MSRVISSGPSLVSRASVSYSSMWMEVNTSCQEYKNCQDSEVAVLAEGDGVVTAVDATHVSVRYDGQGVQHLLGAAVGRLDEAVAVHPGIGGQVGNQTDAWASCCKTSSASASPAWSG